MKTIPYETGIPVIAKEKGFDEPCLGWFSNEELGKYRRSNTVNYNGTNYTGIELCWLAPTYEQLKDWFREKHNIHIMYMICGSQTRVLGYKWFVQVGMNEKDCYQTKMIKDYYQGLDKALIEAFKLI